MALYYSLRNMNTGEIHKLRVGVFEASDTDISHPSSTSPATGIYDGKTFYRSNEWTATANPTFRSIGDSFADVNPDPTYWSSAYFQFVNHPTYYLKANDTQDSGYSNDYTTSYVYNIDTFEQERLSAHVLMRSYGVHIYHKRDTESTYTDAGNIGIINLYADGNIKTNVGAAIVEDNIVPYRWKSNLWSNGRVLFEPCLMFDSNTNTFCWFKYTDSVQIKGLNNTQSTTTKSNVLVSVSKNNVLSKNFMQSVQLSRNTYIDGVNVDTTSRRFTLSDINKLVTSYFTLDYQAFVAGNIAKFWGENDVQTSPTDVPMNLLLYYLLFNKDPDIPPYDPDKPPTEPTGPDDPPGGGGGNEDNSSDDILEPDLPTIDVTQAGIVKLYRLDISQLKNFTTFLWDSEWFNMISKLFNDPMQSVIALMGYNIYIPSSTVDMIQIGNVDTKVSANVIANSKIKIDFGTIHIDKYYNDYSDFSNTDVEIYLPFIGYRALDIYEVMDADITLMYYIDLLTGSFIAMLKISRDRFGTDLNSILYQIEGNMASQYPLSSQDETSYVQALLGTLDNKSVQFSALGNMKSIQERSGALNNVVGSLGVKNAYVRITRNIHHITNNYGKYTGYPYYTYTTIGSCRGFTKCKEVFINSNMGTPEEMAIIENLLKSGILI